MRHRLRSGPATLSLFIVGGSLVIAQQPASQSGAVKEQASAVVIEIPVNVIGKDGKPMTGLKAEDFTLYDDGKKQPISTVELIDLSRPSAQAPAVAAPGAAPSPVPPSARRLWLVVFDLSYTSPSGLLRAREGAINFVTKSMNDNDLAAVGTLSLDTGWKLLVNFTRDRTQLSSAIDTLGLPGAGVSRSPDPLGFAYSSPNPSGSPTGAMVPQGVGLNAGLLVENLGDAKAIQKQTDDARDRGRIVKLLNSLAGIGRVLDSVRGRKHVLFFSEGFETRLLVGNAGGGGRNASLLQDQAAASTDPSTPSGAAEASISGELWKTGENTTFGNAGLRDQLTNALGNFRRSDAVLDTVDISGLRAENDSAGAKPTGTDSLFTMASETEGDFVRNANQLGGELQKVAERTSLVYLLVYQPKQLTKPGTFHKLKVDVKASGAKVAARSGYYEPRPYSSLTPLEQVLYSGDLVTGGSRGDALQGRLLTAPFAAPGADAQVPLVLEIPGTALLAGDKREKTTVQVYAYANDASGTLADYIVAEIALDLTKVRPTLESGGIRFYGTLYLPPGEYGLRALVRDTATGRSGITSAKVSVPKMPGGTPTVLPPVFAAPQGGWVMVRGNPRADAPQHTADYPFAVGGESFIPAALPTVANGAESQVAVFTYNFGGGAKPSPFQVRAQIVAADGTSQPVDLKMIKESDVERGGGRKLLLGFKPEGLAPGRYALKVALTDPNSKATGQSEGAFEVR